MENRYCQFENACLENPCQNNGRCLKDENTFKCNCTSGYVGDRCEMEEPCYFNNPCQHNGTCLKAGNTFKCNCTSGYLGDRCDRCDHVISIALASIMEYVRGMEINQWIMNVDAEVVTLENIVNYFLVMIRDHKGWRLNTSS